MTSFEFSNCAIKNEEKPSSFVQFENENEVITIDKYEQITICCLFSVLKYNIYQTGKGVEC